MVSMRQGLQGRNVYGSGSYAPTRGPVSAQGAQGYLRREVNKPGNRGIHGGVSRFGADGQSDTRSGAAARALNRRGNGGPVGVVQGQQQKTNAAVFNNEGRQSAANLQGQGRGNQAGPGGRPGGRPGGGTTAPNQPWQPPSVTVKADGTLQLPYSEAWSSQLIENLGQYNEDLAGLQVEQQDQALQYSTDKRNAEQDFVDTKRDTLNQNAGRGTAFSSAYGMAVGNNQRDFSNLMSDIELGNTGANTGFDAKRTAIINSFKDQLRREALAYAGEVGDEAGTLGYGRDTSDVKPGRNTSSYQFQQQRRRNRKKRNK